MINWNLNNKELISFLFLIKNIGKTISITYKSFNLNFSIKWVNFFNEKDIQERTLALTSEETENLNIIRILFTNCLNLKPKYKNTTLYLANISKKDGFITGTEAINFAIEIGKNIKGIKKIALHDNAVINCNDYKSNFDLSLYKLLVNKKTLYNKFNFKLWYQNKNQQKNLEKYGKIIGSLKVIDIINEFKDINNLLLNNIDIKYQRITLGDFIIEEFFDENLLGISKKKLILVNKTIIKILINYKKYKFAKAIEILNNKYCNKLSILFSNMTNQNYYIPSILIKDKEYKFKIKSNFIKLLLLKRNFGWKGYYVKDL